MGVAISIYLEQFGMPPLSALTLPNYNPATRLVAIEHFLIDQNPKPDFSSPMTIAATMNYLLAETIFPGIQDYFSRYGEDKSDSTRNISAPNYRYEANGDLTFILRRWFGGVYAPYMSPKHFPEAALIQAHQLEYENNAGSDFITVDRDILLGILNSGIHNNILPTAFILLEIGPGKRPLPVSKLEANRMQAYIGLDIGDYAILPDCGVPAEQASYKNLNIKLNLLKSEIGNLPIIAVGSYSLHHLKTEHIRAIYDAIGLNGVILGNFAGAMSEHMFQDFLAIMENTGFYTSADNFFEPSGMSDNTYIISARENSNTLAHQLAKCAKRFFEEIDLPESAPYRLVEAFLAEPI